MRSSYVVSIPASAVVDDLRLYAHAVNVALLALQSAKTLGYNDIQMRDIALGCLLHDIGKAITTDDKKHPEAGFQYLRTIREINLLVAHIAFQHHEKIDGTGYPRAISGNEVHDYAQLCSMANLYDNLLTVQQVFPHEVMEAVMALNGTAYKESIVKAFIHSIAPYPPGTKIVLNNGEHAIVTRITSNKHRPYIRLLTTGEELSLTDHPTLLVSAVQA